MSQNDCIGKTLKPWPILVDHYTERGQTQYGIEVKSEYSFKLMDIFIDFKQKTESTIIGMRRRNEKVVILNPDLETIIHPGDTLYYISDERVDFDQWPTP
ncbi:cation:proton antiporter regulatory subunit [Vibrio cholerae]|uniref:cation:proton antiporter regulatory subunit n=1 Tax=Vibrio cholerae TaxID=666 RepID=UPI001CA37F11|nr:hypothetical protein [Vibrio cholerae]GIB80001.1 potassium channel related protein [Vibrio cholerae]